tara:strand:+ start:993 stop:1403 length:411 start_codon:yes stop_codon:yes gene_type:complete
MKRAIICDCDGTISLRTNRDTYDFNSSIDDKPNSSIIELLKIYKESGFSIIIVTAREEKFKKITEKWLFINNIEYDQIFFRDNKDYRSDEIVKEEIFKKNIKPHWLISFVLDDRDRVVKMWRKIGLTCLQVNEGDF